MKLIVKRAGHVEQYDERKLYASIFAVCIAVKEPLGTAELIAAEVQSQVEKWLEKKHEVTSNDIRRQASAALRSINSDAAYQYMHHRILH